jgi:group I intron endonuclease
MNYVGSARNINKRIKAHIRSLKDNIHINKKIQNDFNKYGIDNFEFKDILHCSVDKLNINELEQIKKFDSINHGYNSLNQGYSINVGLSRTGKQNPMYNKNHSNESKNKISEFRKNHIGWNHSIKTRNKMRIKAKKRYEKGISNNPEKICETKSNLSKNEVIEIIKLLKRGIKQKDIAKKFGLSFKQISKINCNKIWKHIDRSSINP